MKTIHVAPSGKPYEMHIGSYLLEKAGSLIRSVYPNEKVFVVSDHNVWKLYGENLTKSLLLADMQPEVILFPQGEQTKSLAALNQLYDRLVELNMKRSDLLIAFGGGVIGDLTGFCAATYMRGVDYVQIPTTLLAQVDASVGGKTAVNLAGGKNLVGAFWQPKLVIQDTSLLKTLTDRDFSGGMAEVIKYAAIESETLFEKLESAGSRIDTESIMDDIVYECCDIKRKIVEKDEYDKKERMVLNFGHTFGHAVEKLGDFETYTHGEAVAVGMVLAAKLSYYLSVSETDHTSRISALLKRYELPTDCPYKPQELFEPITHDKKNFNDMIQFILIKKIGHNTIFPVAVSELRDLLERRAEEWMN